MIIYDISLPIDPGMPIWPGDPPIVLEQIQSINRGDHVNVTKMCCSVHSLTHVDAPHHFLNNGQTVDLLPLKALIGPVQVVSIPDDIKVITAGVLERSEIHADSNRVLFKTSNSYTWTRGDKIFSKDFVALAPDAADWLVAHGVILIGVDYLSVAQYKKGGPTHRILLSAGIIIVEGLNLSSIEPNIYNMICLPLKIIGSDGAPARVILYN